MNNKIVLGLISIFAVVALVGGVAVATFSSAASNNSNTFGTGTLVLNINGLPGSTSSAVFTTGNSGNKKPGESVTQGLDLHNSGSLDSANVFLTGIDVFPTPTPGGTLGNLADKLTLTIWDDLDNNDVINAPEAEIHTAHLNAASWTNKDLLFGLTHNGTVGDTHHLKATLLFDSDAGDTFQGTSVSFDFNFQISQAP